MRDGQLELDNGLAALSEFFVNDGTLGETLLRVAELACDVSAADMAGITVLVDGRPRTGAFTDPEVPDIDNAQYDSGRGPCLDAFRDQQVHRIDSITEEERWPEFTKEARAHGIIATLSTPVMARGETLGALNLYSRTAPFDDVSRERVEFFARHAAVVLANTQLYWDARHLTEDMQQAMRSRSTIDQAMGILMAGGGRKPDDAFQLLVRASQRENRKLRDVASDVVSDVVSRATEGTGVDRPRPGSGPPGAGKRPSTRIEQGVRAMPRNGTDRQDDGLEQDHGLEQDGDLEGMAVEVNSNQIRNEAMPASHHDEKGQQSVVQNEKHSHRSARHEQAASSQDENSGD